MRDATTTAPEEAPKAPNPVDGLAMVATAALSALEVYGSPAEADDVIAQHIENRAARATD